MFKKYLMALSLIVLSFSLDAIKYTGGGILPYAKDPKTKQIYFLFSRETGGQSKGLWSDFGGKADKNDKNHGTWIAAREYAEESNNLFGNYKTIQNKISRRKRGIYRIESPYALFLMPVAYNSHINRTFQKKLTHAKSFHHREKDKVVWVSAKNVLLALKKNNPVVKVAPGKTIRLRGHAFKLLKKKALPVIAKLSR